MKKYHLQCPIKPKRIWKSRGERIIVAPDLLQREFTTSEPNKKCVMDITFIQYGGTTKYLSTIIDLFSNEIVTHKLYEHQRTPLVIDTLKTALENREHPKGVISHSNLKSEEFQYVKFNSLGGREVCERVKHYLNYYNQERVQEKLGYLTPSKYGVQAAWSRCFIRVSNH